MTPLNREQLDIIFDYCFGVANTEQTEEVQKLISENPEALDFYNKVQNSLSPLGEWEVEPCPDDLVERTIQRVASAQQASHVKLTELLQVEQDKQQLQKVSMWGEIWSRLATAAVFIIVGSIVIMMMNYGIGEVRYRSRKAQCQTQLGNIGMGLSNYISDHQGKLPTVAASAGSPWWKIGAPGKQNVSNTRNIWLLVKNDYVKLEDFMCPGSTIRRNKKYDRAPNKDRYDFPSRNAIRYSLQLMCDKPQTVPSSPKRILISDINPLFEILPPFNKPLKIIIDKALLERNSSNHSRRGQNVLFCDGTVEFMETRTTAAGDDIYTLIEMPQINGNDVPKHKNDIFLAP